MVFCGECVGVCKQESQPSANPAGTVINTRPHPACSHVTTEEVEIPSCNNQPDTEKMREREREIEREKRESEKESVRPGLVQAGRVLATFSIAAGHRCPEYVVLLSIHPVCRASERERGREGGRGAMVLNAELKSTNRILA